MYSYDGDRPLVKLNAKIISLLQLIKNIGYSLDAKETILNDIMVF